MITFVIAALFLVQPIDPELRISPDGVAEFQVGRTFEAVKSSTDWPLTPSIDEGGACEEYRVGDDIGLYFMVENGLVTRVSATDPGWTTAEGIEVGSPASRIHDVYKEKVIRQPPAYADEPAHELVVWTTPDRGFRFEIDDGGLIRTIHAGTRSIQYIEGCL